MTVPRRLLSLLAVVTLGFPFGIFKVLCGRALLASRTGAVVGWPLVALGALDLLLNLISIPPLVSGRPARLGVCFLEHVAVRLAARTPAWREFGLALDAMISFALVAAMITLGLLARLSPLETRVWSACVVLNVLGAGLGRLATSVGELMRGR